MKTLLKKQFINIFLNANQALSFNDLISLRFSANQIKSAVKARLLYYRKDGKLDINLPNQN